jgi:arsenate reductase
MVNLLWHNPRCSKSRAAKELLDGKGVQYEIFEYLKEPISKDELLRVFGLLEISDIKDMLRKKEDEYKELNVDSKSENEIINIAISNPKLIERPIYVTPTKAAIGRPLENIEAIL